MKNGLALLILNILLVIFSIYQIISIRSISYSINYYAGVELNGLAANPNYDYESAGKDAIGEFNKRKSTITLFAFISVSVSLILLLLSILTKEKVIIKIVNIVISLIAFISSSYIALIVANCIRNINLLT